MAIIAMARQEWQAALLWMGAALFVDSIDGSLARACKVKQVLPYFDGSLLDNMIDYFTYVVVSAVFLLEAPVLPEAYRLPAAMAMIFASAYQLCQIDAKTEDHFFKGWPSYWNVVVAYLYVCHAPAWLEVAFIFGFAVAAFVPVKYVYPGRTKTLRPLTLVLTALWAVGFLAIILRYPNVSQLWIYGSLVYAVYYVGLSLVLTFIERPKPAA